MKNILVAIDGSEHSRRAVELAADIASKYNARLILLHVIENRSLSEDEKQLAETEFSTEVEHQQKTAGAANIFALETEGFLPVVNDHAKTGQIIRMALGKARLKSAVADAKQHGAAEIETMLETGEPASVILDVADRCKVNLIVIGSRGQSDIKALFLGSVSHKVTNLADVNVVTVK